MCKKNEKFLCEIDLMLTILPIFNKYKNLSLKDKIKMVDKVKKELKSRA